MRTRSQDFASIVGPTLVVLAVTEKLNLGIWTPASAPVTYLNGLVLFVAGLCIVRFHPTLTGWPVTITLVGWMVMAVGLYRLIAPQAPQASDGLATDVVFLIMLLVGGFLTVMGYARRASDESGR